MTSATTNAAKFHKWCSSVAELSAGARIRLIRAGIRADILIVASEHFDMSQAEFARFLGLSPTTAQRKIKMHEVLGKSESERLARLAVICDLAEKVFVEAQVAREWLMQKNIALGDSPWSMLDTGIGTEEVRKVLTSIAHGGAV